MALGNVNIDQIFASTPRLPEWGTESFLPRFDLRVAGQAANFAIAMNNLGLKCALVAKVGDDFLGRFMLKELRQSGVDSAHVDAEKGTVSGVTVAIVRSDGERSFITHLGNLGEYTVRHLEQNLNYIMKAQAIHIGGYFVLPKLSGRPLLRIVKRLKQRDGERIFSLDTGWDPGGWKAETLQELYRVLEHIDIFLPDIHEACAITGERSPQEAIEKLSSAGLKIVAIKMGAKGSLVSSGKERVFSKPFKVKVHDATGVGDAFDAAFVLGVWRRLSLRDTATLANAVAAISVSRGGPSVNRYPTMGETRRFLNTHGEKEISRKLVP